MPENLDKICALICAYNEQKTIAKIVAGSKRYVDAVVVVDDGSHDRTAILASEAGAILLQHARNLGKGAALKTGFNYFLKQDYDVVVTLDADGQHLPEEIPLFVSKLKEGYDAVIGKRDFRGKNVPFTRKAGNLLDSYALSKLLSEDIYDAQNGFRAFRRECLSQWYSTIANNGFPYEAEVVVRLLKNKFRVGWVDITAVYSKELESKIKPFRHTFESLKLYAKCFFGKI